MKKRVLSMLCVGMLALGSLSVYGAEEAKDSVVVVTALEPSVFFMQHAEIGTQASFAKDCTVLYNIYDTLFVINNDGEFTPRLGTDYTVSEDGLEYVVTIRDDAYFSNGDKVTAEDVAFSANLMKEQVPPNAKGMFTNFEVAEVVDDTHVKYTLSAPFAAFPNCWTSRCVPVISKAYWEEVGDDGYQANPVGSGPYVLEEVVSGEYITLKANENYWGGAPAIETVTIKTISNVSTQFVELESGEADVILNANMASCLQLDGVTATYATTESGTRAVALINTNPAHGSLLTDINIRKAIASCVSREDLVIGVCEGNGSENWVDMIQTYSGVPDLSQCVQALPYDLAAAQDYLKEAGYNGETIKLMCNAGTRTEQAASIVQGAMIGAGINAEVLAVDGGTSSAALASGEWDVYFLETTGSLYDSSCLNNIYTSASFAQMQNDEDFAFLSETIAAQLVNTDPESRKEQTGVFLDYLNENVLSVPLYCPVSTIAYNPELKGVEAHPQIYSFINEWSWE